MLRLRSYGRIWVENRRFRSNGGPVAPTNHSSSHAFNRRADSRTDRIRVAIGRVCIACSAVKTRERVAIVKHCYLKSARCRVAHNAPVWPMKFKHILKLYKVRNMISIIDRSSLCVALLLKRSNVSTLWVKKVDPLIFAIFSLGLSIFPWHFANLLRVYIIYT